MNTIAHTQPEIAEALRNWIPVRMIEEERALLCRWLFTGDKMYTEPFFDDTISQCRQLPENGKMRRTVSTLSVLPDWASSLTTLPPTALIFHVSRCGSTLLSQLLALDPANIVLSEVPFFDQLLQHGLKNGSQEEATGLLAAALAFYGARRRERQQRLFVKTDSWHVHFYRQWRSLCPGIPIVLLYRRPDEVIRSQQKKRGMQAVPGVVEPAVFGFRKEEVVLKPLDEYMALVLETYYAAFLNILHADPLAIPCNYAEGMTVIHKRILDTCGIEPEQAAQDLAEERSTFHGKYPEEKFAEDAITGERPPYLEKAWGLYEELESWRLTHPPTS